MSRICYSTNFRGVVTETNRDPETVGGPDTNIVPKNKEKTLTLGLGVGSGGFTFCDFSLEFQNGRVDFSYNKLVTHNTVYSTFVYRRLSVQIKVYSSMDGLEVFTVDHQRHILLFERVLSQKPNRNFFHSKEI